MSAPAKPLNRLKQAWRAEAGIFNSGVPIDGVARTAEQANAVIARGYLALALGFDWSLFQLQRASRGSGGNWSSAPLCAARQRC